MLSLSHDSLLSGVYVLQREQAGARTNMWVHRETGFIANQSRLVDS